MVGEMRDLETIQLAITASETGHLVLGTLHTANAARTLDRVLDVFPVDQREQIRVMVSESLRGIISQQLVPRKDGKGRVLAIEILMNTPAVANIIREAKTFMLPGIIQTGKKLGMKLMDDSLMELYDQPDHLAGGSLRPRRAEGADARNISRTDDQLHPMAYIDQFFEVSHQRRRLGFAPGEGQPPKIRRHGEIMPIREEPLTTRRWPTC